METLEFKQEIGGTESCMKILIMGTKGCGQLSSNDIYFAGSWFSGVKTAEEAIAELLNYYRPLKTSH